MKLVIDIPEEMHERIKDGYVPLGINKYLKNGIPYKTRPNGEWIVRRNKQRAHIYSVCSKCNVPYLDTDFPNFCPNCGTDMRGEAE